MRLLDPWQFPAIFFKTATAAFMVGLAGYTSAGSFEGMAAGVSSLMAAAMGFFATQRLSDFLYLLVLSLHRPQRFLLALHLLPAARHAIRFAANLSTAALTTAAFASLAAAAAATLAASAFAASASSCATRLASAILASWARRASSAS